MIVSKEKRKSIPAASSEPVENLFAQNLQNEFWMSFALAEAQQAYHAGEVPIGAVIMMQGEIIGRGCNQPIASCDPTAHAEIIALREAAQKIGNYRLSEATIYVTIEPCVMCAGALVNARIKHLVYGAAEARTGAVSSIFQLCSHRSLNHHVEITAGVREADCKQLMQAFFKARR